MNRLIELTSDEIMAVSGGCWCYCFREADWDTRMRSPLILVGEVATEDDCKKECGTHPLSRGYSKCVQYEPLPGTKITPKEDPILLWLSSLV